MNGSCPGVNPKCSELPSLRPSPFAKASLAAEWSNNSAAERSCQSSSLKRARQSSEKRGAKCWKAACRRIPWQPGGVRNGRALPPFHITLYQTAPAPGFGFKIDFCQCIQSQACSASKGQLTNNCRDLGQMDPLRNL